MRFFCSDHHFGHTKQFTSYGRKGLFSSNDEMTEYMISQHNAVVKKHDIVYFVGDFSFTSFEASKKILSRLNGEMKILVQGNHCLSEKRHISVKEYLEMGFDDVVQEKIIKISNGEDVLLKHYPYQKGFFQNLWMGIKDYFRSEENKRYKKYHAYYPHNRGLWLIHGHIHRGPKRIKKQINVNVETWDYLPVSETQICKLMNEYEGEKIMKKLSRLKCKVTGFFKSLLPKRTMKGKVFRNFERALKWSFEDLLNEKRKCLFLGFNKETMKTRSIGLVNTLISGRMGSGKTHTAMITAHLFKALDPVNHELRVIDVFRDAFEYKPLEKAGFATLSHLDNAAVGEGEYGFLAKEISLLHKRLRKPPTKKKTLVVIEESQFIDEAFSNMENGAEIRGKFLEILEKGSNHGIAVMMISQCISSLPSDILKKLYVKITHSVIYSDLNLLSSKDRAQFDNEKDYRFGIGEFVVNGERLCSPTSPQICKRNIEDLQDELLSIVVKQSRGQL